MIALILHLHPRRARSSSAAARVHPVHLLQLSITASLHIHDLVQVASTLFRLCPCSQQQAKKTSSKPDEQHLYLCKANTHHFCQRDRQKKFVTKHLQSFCQGMIQTEQKALEYSAYHISEGKKGLAWLDSHCSDFGSRSDQKDITKRGT